MTDECECISTSGFDKNYAGTGDERKEKNRSQTASLGSF